MRISVRSAVVAITVGSGLTVAFFAYRTREAAVSAESAPLPKIAHRLTTAQAEDILRSDFRVVSRVQEVPTSVKDDYYALTHERFRMVNLGETVSTDAIIPGVPNKQLVLMGISGRTSVLIFNNFGIARSVRVAIFSHSQDDGAWGAEIAHSVRDIPALRKSIQTGDFQSWPLRE